MLEILENGTPYQMICKDTYQFVDRLSLRDFNYHIIFPRFPKYAISNFSSASSASNTSTTIEISILISWKGLLKPSPVMKVKIKFSGETTFCSYITQHSVTRETCYIETTQEPTPPPIKFNKIKVHANQYSVLETTSKEILF